MPHRHPAAARSYWRKRYEQKVSRGECLRCPVKAERGRRMCRAHLARAAAWQREAYIKRGRRVATKDIGASEIERVFEMARQVLRRTRHAA